MTAGSDDRVLQKYRRRVGMLRENRYVTCDDIAAVRKSGQFFNWVVIEKPIAREINGEHFRRLDAEAAAFDDATRQALLSNLEQILLTEEQLCRSGQGAQRR